MLDTAFAPIIAADAKLLVLGSMPSQTSLSVDEYYAHPRNSFWWIMSQVLGFETQLPYPERCRYITKNYIAIWDVLRACERPGSLDADIVKGSEQINDFKALLESHPQLKHIVFNGRTAQALFTRYCKDLLERADISVDLLPSTSPAHASLSRQDKLVQWQAAIESRIGCQSQHG